MGPEIEREPHGRDPWVDRLSEYLDGDLTRAEREALELHLAACASCAEALDDLRAVVSRAHALEDVPPAEDLWPAIEAQIATAIAPAASPGTAEGAGRRGRAPIDARDRLWWARRVDLSLPQLAAAAVLLVALSAGMVWLALRGSTLTPATPAEVSRSPRAVAAAPETLTPAPALELRLGAAPASEQPLDAATATALAVAANPRYDAAIAELERAVSEGRGQLNPRTLRVVEQNLRTIDRALEQARRAVAADPGNLWLRSHLAATMKRKVDLLRTATQLAAAEG